MKREDCPFCNVAELGHEIIIETENCVSFYNKFPICKGHALVVCKDHRGLKSKWYNEYWQLIEDTVKILEVKFHPDGMNIGMNRGFYAGQSVEHEHMHLIPRYKGDVENPIGGVCNIVPHLPSYYKNEENETCHLPANLKPGEAMKYGNFAITCLDFTKIETKESMPVPCEYCDLQYHDVFNQCQNFVDCDLSGDTTVYRVTNLMKE